MTTLIKIYQMTISPILRVMFGKGCRYEVTCSQYAIDSIQKYGTFKGSLMAAKRLSTCHI